MWLRLFGISVFLSAAILSSAQNSEPSLKQVFSGLGLNLDRTDEIKTNGIFQGLFIPIDSSFEVLLVAKYSFGKQDKVSHVRAGYYSMSNPGRRFSLFECGPEAGDRNQISGLPAHPRGPYRITSANGPVGFYVQCANFNAEFSENGETVFSQDNLNKKIIRFKNNIHKVRVYPYRTQYGVKPNWYVLCWEFTGDNDFQDLITVVRGVKIILPPPKPKKKIPNQDRDFNPRIALDL